MSSVAGAIEFFNRVKKFIDSDVATKTVRKGVMEGLKIIGQRIKQDTPVEEPKTPPRRWRRPPYTGSFRQARPGRLQAASGKARFSRGTGRSKKQKLIIAKTGMNVAQKMGSRSDPKYPFSPHAPLVALGTKDRVTKKGARRGRMWGKKPNPHHVRRATTATAGAAQEKMISVIRGNWSSMVEAAKR